MRKALKKIAGWIGAAGVFLLLANLKAVAETLGLDKLATNPTFLGAVISTRTSPAAYAIGLICFGVGLWTVADFFARKWEANHPSQDSRLISMWPDMYDLSETLGSQLENGQVLPSMGVASRVAAKYTTLGKLGVSCPVVPPDGRYWFACHKLFLDQIVPILREGHAKEARTLAAGFVKAVNETTPEARAATQQQLDQQFGKTPFGPSY
jgi:hypothetical protein